MSLLQQIKTHKKLVLAGVLAAGLLLFCAILLVEAVAITHEGAERQAPSIGTVLAAVKRQIVQHIHHIPHIPHPHHR